MSVPDPRVVPLRPLAPAPADRSGSGPASRRSTRREPLWRHVVGDVLRRERLRQHRILREVADHAQVSMAYLSEVERGRKEASSEILAAAAHALGLSLAEVLARAQLELVEAAPMTRTLDLTTRHPLASGQGNRARFDHPGSVSLAA